MEDLRPELLEGLDNSPEDLDLPFEDHGTDATPPAAEAQAPGPDEAATLRKQLADQKSRNAGLSRKVRRDQERFTALEQRFSQMEEALFQQSLGSHLPVEERAARVATFRANRTVRTREQELQQVSDAIEERARRLAILELSSENGLHPDQLDDPALDSPDKLLARVKELTSGQARPAPAQRQTPARSPLTGRFEAAAPTGPAKAYKPPTDLDEAAKLFRKLARARGL